MTIGKNMRAALEFAIAHPGWHSYSRRDRPTVATIARLAERELIEIDADGRFRAIPQAAAPVRARLATEPVRAKLQGAGQACA